MRKNIYTCVAAKAKNVCCRVSGCQFQSNRAWAVKLSILLSHKQTTTFVWDGARGHVRVYLWIQTKCIITFGHQTDSIFIILISEIEFATIRPEKPKGCKKEMVTGRVKK